MGRDNENLRQGEGDGSREARLSPAAHALLIDFQVLALHPRTSSGQKFLAGDDGMRYNEQVTILAF